MQVPQLVLSIKGVIVSNILNQELILVSLDTNVAMTLETNVVIIFKMWLMVGPRIISTILSRMDFGPYIYICIYIVSEAIVNTVWAI